MTNAARIYGNRLYDLAQEEGCVEPMAEQLQQIRTLFAEKIHPASTMRIRIRESHDRITQDQCVRSAGFT